MTVAAGLLWAAGLWLTASGWTRMDDPGGLLAAGLGNLAGAAGWAVAGVPVVAAVLLVIAVLALWSWWNGPGGRDRVARALGAKARAARNALVRTLREREVAVPA